MEHIKKVSVFLKKADDLKWNSLFFSPIKYCEGYGQNLSGIQVFEHVSRV